LLAEYRPRGTGLINRLLWHSEPWLAYFETNIAGDNAASAK